MGLEIPKQMIPWTEVESAYIAGIIDGEGCLRLYRLPDGHICTIIYIANTKGELIDWLYRMIGSGCYRQERHKDERRRANQKPWYTLTISTKPVVHEIAIRIVPYLRVKREQAEILIRYIEWRETLGWRGLRHPFSREERGHTDVLIAQVRRLNKRGPS